MEQAVQAEMNEPNSNEKKGPVECFSGEFINGDSAVEKLVKTTNQGHKNTNQWIRLVESFQSTQNDQKKHQIAIAFSAIEEENLEILRAFHDVMDDIADYFTGKLIKLFLIISLVEILLINVLGFLITRSITRPLKKTVTFIKAVSSGDLTQEIEVKHMDEVGVMASAMNAMAINLRKMFQGIVSDTRTLTASSTELSAVSEEIASNSKQTSDRSNTVSVSAEEMASNMNSVAAAMEQTASNLQMIVFCGRGDDKHHQRDFKKHGKRE